jgi:hypothetical protein
MPKLRVLAIISFIKRPPMIGIRFGFSGIQYQILRMPFPIFIHDTGLASPHAYGRNTMNPAAAARIMAPAIQICTFLLIPGTSWRKITILRIMNGMLAK